MSNTSNFNRENQLFAMWEREGKTGNKYLSGKYNDEKLLGFYTNKKAMSEGDITIHISNDAGLQQTGVLFVNVNKRGKKYVKGTVFNTPVVGFFNEKHTEKQPYITIYKAETERKEEQEELPESV